MIDDIVRGVDLRVFIALEEKHSLSSVSEVVNRYVLIVDKLHRQYPMQEPLWYQEEGLRRTDTYFKVYNEHSDCKEFDKHKRIRG